MAEQIISLLKEILPEEDILQQERMEKHTSFRIGGPADVFVMPENTSQIRHVIEACRSCGIPWFVLGNGTNLLVSDRGFRGLVIQIGKKMSQTEVDGERIIAGAGALLSGIALLARNHALTGMEFAGGIPGSLGGAAWMNAGAYGGEMKDILTEVTLLTEDGEEKTVPYKDLLPGYRTTLIQETGDLVTGAVLTLSEGDPEAIRQKMQELQQKRNEKQPLEYPSAGSTFKRPEGYFAGKLISDAGLRGYQVGGARVSDKHAGFVINTGGATAQDVMQLMQDVRDKVYSMSGVELEREVRLLGDF